jgi:poly(3-hydroxyalkanoate) synthetase
MYFLLERHLLSSQLVTERDHRRSATFLTHTDFSVPGILGVFLDSDKMAHTFDVLRANDLVFHCVVNNWLLG